MLTKDKKPEEKETRKEAAEVIPPRPDTPKLFKAALKVTERAGIEGTFAKMKKVYQPPEGQTEVGREGWREEENKGGKEVEKEGSKGARQSREGGKEVENQGREVGKETRMFLSALRVLMK